MNHCELSALDLILQAIPDKSRVRRLLAYWKDQAQDLLHLTALERSIIDLSKRVPSDSGPSHNGGALLTFTEACAYLKVGETYFKKLRKAGLIIPANQIGNKHLFSVAHLDDFLAMPLTERNRRLHDHRLKTLKVA